MTETVKKRRRWPWVILAAVLLLVGGPIAWRLRPLNATERRLVGTWTPEDPAMTPELLPFTLKPDRTLFYSALGGTLTFPGRWDATSETIEIQMDPDPDRSDPIIPRLLRLYRQLSGQHRRPLLFDNDDTIELEGIPFKRVPTTSRVTPVVAERSV